MVSLTNKGRPMIFERFWWNVQWPSLVVRFVARRGLKVAASVMLFYWAILNLTQGAVNFRIDAVSVADLSAPRPVSALGDSFALSVTPDGAFVLFISTANNIVTNDSNGAFLDLFLRCRTNGTVKMVSVNALGTAGGDSDSGEGDVTPDGRFVVFQSDASDLVTNDTNQASDVFVRDMTAGITRLVSVNRLGTASGNGPSSDPVITPDGRYVVFISAASDLVDGDANNITDVFIRDMQRGVTTLVSVGAQSVYSNGVAYYDTAAVTPDGRFVAFSTSASNLVASMQNTYQEIYVRDLLLGQTIWANTNVTPAAFSLSYNPLLSDDGRFVAFWSDVVGKSLMRRDLQSGALDIISTNSSGTGLEMTPDGRFIAFAEATITRSTNSAWLWDAQTQTATLVSVNQLGQPSTNGVADSPSLSSDGRYVAFLSSGTDLVTNEVSGDLQVYVRDMQAGVTKLVSADANGRGVGSVDTAPIISANGNAVVFDSRSEGFVPDDLNNAYDVFASDTISGQIELISPGNSTAVGTTANGLSSVGANSISADGRYVVFESVATDLTPGVTNIVFNVFMRDLLAGTNQLVSVNRFGTGGGAGNSYGPAISANGRYVMFFSAADDLVANDTNKVEDLFVRDLQTGTTQLVSVNTNGFSGNRTSSAASISADGTRVAFQSAASDLVGGDNNVTDDIFVRDVATGTTMQINANIPGTSLGSA